jgi:hypothetical protein
MTARCASGYSKPSGPSCSEGTGNESVLSTQPEKREHGDYDNDQTYNVDDVVHGQLLHTVTPETIYNPARADVRRAALGSGG